MLIKEENQYGTIEINRNVIGRIVLSELKHYEGSISITGKNARLAPILRHLVGDGDVSNMEIEQGESGLDVKLYVLMKFGTSISKVGSEFIGRICNGIEEQLGIPDANVLLIVKGLVVKNEVRPRNIEVHRDGSMINEADR